RLLGRQYDGDEVVYLDNDRDSVYICGNHIYRHKVLRINYTTYDLRRSQDSVNPRTHPDIMLLSHDSESHPYWYARVIGIFHVDIIHTGPHSISPNKQRVDFLWIRWFGRDLTYAAGWKAQRLHRVGFLDAEQSGAFGFLDPAVVLRGVHMMPGFACGTTNEYLHPPRSVARMPLNEVTDWQYYYVGMFVDRDMAMRFMGGGVGHKATNAFTGALAHEARNNGSNIDDNGHSEDPELEPDYIIPDSDDEEEDLVDGYTSSESDPEDGNGALELGEDSDEDIGGEDGEEPWEIDDVQAEGFDAL
ncbi:hypothetical protein B0H34DRAFT_668897, partial [Crassisporium funariophilum]